MTLRSLIQNLGANENLNFLLTNRVPRHALTRFVGWLSKIEQPFVRDLSIAIWKQFSDLDLSEAKEQSFKSMHDCFTRRLKDGARPIESRPDILVSPCDAIVGTNGVIDGETLIQAKGFTYSLTDLLGDAESVESYRDGTYVTLRLTSTMYHRFHAPGDCHVEQVNYIAGDTWNVNPIALKRIEKLFCKNERAVIRTRLAKGDHAITLVPVAAILVASIRLHFVNALLHIRYKGPNVIPCDADFKRGDEMGWFEHGSTIIVFAPKGFAMCEGAKAGAIIRMGRPLMVLPPGA